MIFKFLAILYFVCLIFHYIFFCSPKYFQFNFFTLRHQPLILFHRPTNQSTLPVSAHPCVVRFSSTASADFRVLPTTPPSPFVLVSQNAFALSRHSKIWILFRSLAPIVQCYPRGSCVCTTMLATPRKNNIKFFYYVQRTAQTWIRESLCTFFYFSNWIVIITIFIRFPSSSFESIATTTTTIVIIINIRPHHHCLCLAPYSLALLNKPSQASLLQFTSSFSSSLSSYHSIVLCINIVAMPPKLSWAVLRGVQSGGTHYSVDDDDDVLRA